MIGVIKHQRNEVKKMRKGIQSTAQRFPIEIIIGHQRGWREPHVYMGVLSSHFKWVEKKTKKY